MANTNSKKSLHIITVFNLITAHYYKPSDSQAIS